MDTTSFFNKNKRQIDEVTVIKYRNIILTKGFVKSVSLRNSVSKVLSKSVTCLSASKKRIHPVKCFLLGTHKELDILKYHIQMLHMTLLYALCNYCNAFHVKDQKTESITCLRYCFSLFSQTLTMTFN